MTTFANASTLGQLLPDGSDSVVLRFSAATQQGGFIVDPGISGAVKNYTMVFDLNVGAADMGGFAALFQTDLNNTSDADFFIRKTGSTFGVGISSNYDGAAALGAWHRVAVTIQDLGDGTATMTKFIDGAKVDQQVVDMARFIVSDSGFLILTDEDGETASGSLNSFLFADHVMTEAEMQNLGGVAAGGILSQAPATGNATQFDFDGQNLVSTFGPGSLVDRDAPAPVDPVAVASRIQDMMVTPDAANAVIDLAGVFDGEGLTYTVQTAVGEVVSATINAEGKLELDFGELGFSDVKVTATDADGNSASDYFRIRVAGENAYTIAVFPDTQDYTDNAHLNHIFGDMTQWLVDNKDSHNIQFMIHVGDITQNNLSSEWDVAEAALRKLDGKIPYSLLPGNHDQAAGGSAADHTSIHLDERFSPEDQTATNPDNFGGVYDQETTSSRNTWNTFTAPDGTKWLVLSIEFGPRDDVIRWAGDVIEQHLDHRVIVASHSLTDFAGRHDPLGAPLYDEGAGYDYGIGRDPQGANDGEAVYRALLAKYPNISMTFSGHIFGDGAETNVSYSQYGNPVFEMLVNYQNGISREITGNGNEALGNNGGNGAIRLVVVDPDNNTISTETYFTEFDDYLDGYRVKPELDRDGLTGYYRGHQETFTDVEVGTPDLYAMAKAGDDLIVEAAGDEKTASVHLDASKSLNPKSESLTYAWVDENGDVVATGATPTVDLGLGKHELTLKVTDANGVVTSDKVLVIVRGDDTLLTENFNDGNADGWVSGAQQAVEIAVGTPESFGVPALPGGGESVAFIPALTGGEKLFLSPLPGVPSGTVITSYSLIMDIYVQDSSTWPKGFIALFQTNIANNDDGDLFIRNDGGVGISGNYQGTVAFDAWNRIAFTFTDIGGGNLTLSKYINGAKVGEQTVSADRFGFDVSKGALLFSDEDGENADLYVSSVLVTDKVYSEAEITALGGPKAGGVAAVQPTIYSTQFDFNTPDLAPTYGPAHLGLNQGGASGAFIVKGTVFSRPTEEAGMPAPEAALYDMTDADGNKLVWNGDGAADWSDYVYEATITSTDNDTIGLIFYYQDDQNYYRFTMDGETNRRELVKVQNGIETVLAATEMGYQFNVGLKLKIAIVDNSINVFLDDRSVFDGPVVDSANPLMHGTVGLYSSGQRSSIFDDIAVNRVNLTAHAGEDARVFDLDGDGKAQVELDGDGSFGLANIVSWRWTDKNGNEVATGKNPTVELGVGVNKLTLTVTDAGGMTATDRVDVNVVAHNKILLSDTFGSSASLSQWTIVDEGEFGGVGPDGKSSEWLLSNGALTQTSDLQSRELTWEGATNPDYWERGWSPLGDGVNVLRVGTYALYNNAAAQDWDDYSLQATIATPDNDGLGFLFHYKDAHNYYKLELDSEGTLDRNPSNGAGSLFNLVRMRDGVEEILGQVPGKYEPGQAFTLRVDIVGNTIQAYINDEPIFAYAIEDHSNEKGTVGLYSWGNQGLAFDDVVVVDLTPPDTVQTIGFAADSYNVFAAEGDNGSKVISFIVERTSSGDNDGAVEFSGEFSAYAGLNAADFGGVLPTAFSGVVPNGAASTTVSITISGDKLSEGHELFNLYLNSVSNPSAATIAIDSSRNNAYGTIINDDGPLIVYSDDVIAHRIGLSGQTSLTIEQGGVLQNGFSFAGPGLDAVINNASAIDAFFLGSEVDGRIIFNNEATGVVTGRTEIADLSPGSEVIINNAGLFTGAHKTLKSEGSGEGYHVTINNLAGGVIDSGSEDNKAIVVRSNVTITNAGKIIVPMAPLEEGRDSAGGEAIEYTGDNVTLHNLAGGWIEGSHHAYTGEDATTVTNDAGGVMIGRNGSAVNIDNDSAAEDTVFVINHGLMQGKSQNYDDSDGDAVDVDGRLNLENWGVIEGLGHNGYHKGEPNVSEGVAAGAAVINNHAGAKIYGYGRAIQIDNSSNQNAFAPTTIINAGLIQGDGHGPTEVTPEEEALFAERIRGGEAVNIVGDWGDSLTNRAGGQIIGGVKMGGGDDTLTNAGAMAATGGSAIDMGEGDDTVTLRAGAIVAGLIIGGDGDDILNLEGKGAGSFGAVDGIETINLLGGDWTIGGETSAKVLFGAGAQTLRLDQGIIADGDFDGVLAGFGSGDVINLKGLAGATSATLGAGNLLTIAGGANGPVAIQFDPTANFANTLFKLSSDGQGGTNLKLLVQYAGGAGDDDIVGGDGADQMIGGAGSDAMHGGAGDDNYFVDNVGDVADETNAGGGDAGGLDTVTSRVSFTLGAYIERLTLSGSADIDGTGNDLNNIIYGNAGRNTLSGGDGKDSLISGAGDDFLFGGSGNDHLVGGAGADQATGGAGADAFTFTKAELAHINPGDGFDMIMDFEGAGNGYRSSEDMITFTGFSAAATLTHVGEIAGHPEQNLYEITDGAFKAQLIIQYAGQGSDLKAGDFIFYA